MLFNLDDFFEGVTDEECNGTIDYKISQLLIDTLDAMSRVSGESLYVINYLSRGFLYVSQNPLFLNGYLKAKFNQRKFNKCNCVLNSFS